MSPLPPADMRARVLAAVRRSPVPTRAQGARRRIASVAAGFALTLAVGMRLGVHPGARPSGYIWLLSGAWLLIAVTATWAGVARGASMIGRATAWKIAVIMLVPVGMLGLWWPIALSWPSTMEGDSGGLYEIVRCLVGTALLAIGPLLAFGYALRESVPVDPRLSSAAIAAASGAWGATALVIICRHASASHMVFGHVLPVMLLSAFGAFVGARTLGLRRVGLRE